MSSAVTGSLDAILAAQNPDGGWGYRKSGGSWTEPTCYALLGLKAAIPDCEQVRRGVAWIASTQKQDGGWAPRPSVDQSTWVTALVLVALADTPAAISLSTASAWLVARTGRESTLLERLRMRLLGIRPERDADSAGWPWYPDTAAWVSPTAISVLALKKLALRQPGSGYQHRIEMGQRFLMDKMCQDGGWNHGSSRALGYESPSYPETTGLALLALGGVKGGPLSKAIAAGERHLRECRSAEGQSWLRMGLLAHGRDLGGFRLAPASCRTLMDTCLTVLADAAAAGKNPFLE